MIGVRRSGNWGFAASFVGRMAERVKGGLTLALRREGLLAERMMKEGIRDQAPGGKTFTALAELTLIKRKAQGFGGTKALIRNGDLRRSIRTVGPIAATVFSGVLRNARGRGGENLYNIAQINEKGKTMVISVDKPGKGGKTVRDFFWALLRKGLIKKPLKLATKFLVVRIPPRPFVGPVAEKLKDGRDKRIAGVLAQHIGLTTS